jgi:excisionase family DNA binding protein
MQLLTLPEATTQLRVAPRTVYREIARGNLPVVRIGKAVRILQDDLDAYVEKNRA